MGERHVILREQRQERANLDTITARLELSLVADRPEIATIRSLWRTLEQWRQYDVVDAVVPRIITSGWAAWCRRTHTGRRIIFLLLVPGDVITPVIANGNSACFVEALTRLRCVDATELTVADLRGEWLAPKARTLIGGADEDHRQRVLDHLAWSNDHDGARSLARLLLELHDRLSMIGRCNDGYFELPIGQRILAQALGLSVVHVNKLVGQLRSGGMIDCGRGWLRIADPDILRCFAAQYASPRGQAAAHLRTVVTDRDFTSQDAE